MADKQSKGDAYENQGGNQSAPQDRDGDKRDCSMVVIVHKRAPYVGGVPCPMDGLHEQGLEGGIIKNDAWILFL